MSFYDAVVNYNGGSPFESASIVNREMIMRDDLNHKYWKIKFTAWSDTNGTFSYTYDNALQPQTSMTNIMLKITIYP